MSLRDRLTLLNLILLGGLFIFFGVVAYVVVTVMLYNQIDNSLEKTAQQLVQQARVNNTGEMGEIVTPNLRLTSNILVQVWDEEPKLVDYSPGLAEVKVPFDRIGFAAKFPSYRDVTFETDIHLRVLSVPLVSEGRLVGVVQVATNLDVVDSARRNLFSVLVFATVLGVGIAALASQAAIWEGSQCCP